MIPIRYGTLAHTFGCLPLKSLTATLQNYDIDFVQLALSKAIQNIDTSTGKLSPGLANYIAEQFDRAGIRIGVLGCYINPIHPDPVIRRLEIDRFKEQLYKSLRRKLKNGVFFWDWRVSASIRFLHQTRCAVS